MKKLLFGFIILIFSVWIGFLMHRDPGYVLVSFGTWSIESSLWVGIVSLLLTFLILYMLLRLFKQAKNLKDKIKTWSKQRKENRAITLTHRGLQELTEGEWGKAENHLIKATKGNDYPLINYLAAAKAANANGDFDKRDKYLQTAYKKDKEAKLSIGLTKAKLQLGNDNTEGAITTLNHLYKDAPNNKLILQLLSNALLDHESWNALNSLYPKLKKSNALSDVALTALQEKIYIGLLYQSTDAENLESIWEDIPKAWRTKPSITKAFACKTLHIDNKYALAIKAIESTLKKEWDPTLLGLYSYLSQEDGTKQLNLAESWLKKHPNEPKLLLCLARLSMREKLWGMAKQYLETAIKHDPSSQTYYELARTYEELNNDAMALQQYRLGAQHAGRCSHKST